jgi:protein-S-isoprenylcysteine O-methyltransferase Ste14
MEKDPSIGSGCWYLGMIYINPDDRRIIVRKKSRLGWTFNFARPLAIPTLILTCAYVLAPFYLLERLDIKNPWAYVGAYVIALVGLVAFCSWMEKRHR